MEFLKRIVAEPWS